LPSQAKLADDRHVCRLNNGGNEVLTLLPLTDTAAKSTITECSGMLPAQVTSQQIKNEMLGIAAKAMRT